MMNDNGGISAVTSQFTILHWSTWQHSNTGKYR